MSLLLCFRHAWSVQRLLSQRVSQPIVDRSSNLRSFASLPSIGRRSPGITRLIVGASLLLVISTPAIATDHPASSITATSPQSTSAPETWRDGVIAQANETNETEAETDNRDRRTRDRPATEERDPPSRTTLFAFLIAMSVIPALATIGVWLLLNKLETRANAYIDEMTQLKADAIVQLQGLMDDAQSVIEGVRDRLDTAIDAPSLPEIDGEVSLENLATISADANGRTAIPSAEAAGVISPEDYCRRGNALFLSGDYTESVDAYDRALALNPDYYQAWSNRGSALFNLEQYEASIASYDRALDLKDDYPEAWNNRGSSLIKLGDYRAAAFSFAKATSLKPGDLDAWNNRGFVLMQLGKHKEALAAYSQAVKLDPNSVQAWHDRGRATLKLKRYEQALQCFDKAIGLSSNHLGAWRDRAVALEKLGRANDAYEALSHALLLDPDQIDLWSTRGDLNYNRQRYIEAIEDYDQALELAPQSNLWFKKACCYAASSEPRSALIWLTQAIEADAAYITLAVNEPTLASLRSNPTFQALVGEPSDALDEVPPA